MSIDHTGPHGICPCDNTYTRNCTCPEFMFTIGADWACTCCQGSIPDGLELIDVLLYSTMRSRITRAVARASSPLKKDVGSLRSP